MKSHKTNIILAAACAVIVTLIVNNQPAISQTVPPSSPPAFTAHYSEINIRLAPGESSTTHVLPVLDRAVHMSMSLVFDDGQYTAFQPVCFYATVRGEFAVDHGGPINNEPDGLGLGGVTLFGGANGTFHFRNDATTNLTLHVGLWY